MHWLRRSGYGFAPPESAKTDAVRQAKSKAHGDDATKPIADNSAYTVMVVRRIDLHDGPNLVLNSDYGATDVPGPHGVGMLGKVMLTN